MFNMRKKGQSILEYSIMLAVVIAVLLIMQSFVKRGYQGSLKSSADKMGEQFSAGGTTIKEESRMAEDQKINTEVATTADGIGAVTLPSTLDYTPQHLVDKGSYSLNERLGVDVENMTDVKTDAASKEKVRLTEYDTTEVDDYEVTHND